MNVNYIKCKKISFYSILDETMFFAWIKSINCIENFEGIGDELYLNLVQRQLSYNDIKDLITLMYRYKIKMYQLQPLITEENKFAAAPWKKQIYKTTI